MVRGLYSCVVYQQYWVTSKKQEAEGGEGTIQPSWWPAKSIVDDQGGGGIDDAEPKAMPNIQRVNIWCL